MAKVYNFELYNFVLNLFGIKKSGSAMDENLNSKVKVRGSSPHSYNL
jgi:hypothetical protein